MKDSIRRRVSQVMQAACSPLASLLPRCVPAGRDRRVGDGADGALVHLVGRRKGPLERLLLQILLHSFALADLWVVR